MRRFLPPRSLAWWGVVVCALAAVGIFMVFEVWDLDGSDLYRRLFQPPIAAQSALADAERTMRHGAFGVRENLSSIREAAVFQGRRLLLSSWPQTGPPLSGKRFVNIHRRTDGARVTFRLSASLDEPSRLSARTI